MIDQMTENLINLYLKYSDTKSISVDEFVKIRLCAREECENNSHSSHSVVQPKVVKVKKSVNKPVAPLQKNESAENIDKMEDEVDILSILKSIDD